MEFLTNRGLRLAPRPMDKWPTNEDGLNRRWRVEGIGPTISDEMKLYSFKESAIHAAQPCRQVGTSRPSTVRNYSPSEKERQR